jgi:hypothetical protein
MPGFRRRMARRVAPDEWLYPNINTGCVLRFDESGRIIETLWDLERRQPSDDHLDARAQGPSLHRRHPQQPRRPAEARGRRSGLDWARILLEQGMIGALTRIFDNLLGRGEAAVTVPPLDGAFRPNRLLDEAPSRVALDRADGLAVVAGEIVVSAGDTVYTLAADGTLLVRRSFAAR